MLPVFLKLAGRNVLLVGGGMVATEKLRVLQQAGAVITVVAPEVSAEIAAAGVTVWRRPFEVSDLDDAWFVVSAATPEVNRAVAQAADARHLFVNAVDDPPNATAYLGGVVRRQGVTVAISTDGRAPGIAGLLREGLDAMLPADLDRWMDASDRLKRRWRAENVPMPERRPELLDALVQLYATRANGVGGDGRRDRWRAEPADRRAEPSDRRAEPSGSAAGDVPRGFVSIVGAGPGDPELLTLRAAKRLAEADLVLYDGLVPEIVARMAPSARRLRVSRRPGSERVAPSVVAGLMIEAADGRGQRVVRLRAGDPFVLARGAEEALELAAAGVPFEIVPGLSTSWAAPTLAGIPLTHRGVASSVVVVSGHAIEAYQPVLGSLTPGAATIVVLMGLAERGRLARLLVARGWHDQTPVAILLNASQPAAEERRLTLAQMATEALETVPVAEDDAECQSAARDRGGSPGVLVIGDVVEIGRRLAESMVLPAPGRRVEERQDAAAEG